jgi:hypothetical protein
MTMAGSLVDLIEKVIASLPYVAAASVAFLILLLLFRKKSD